MQYNEWLEEWLTTWVKPSVKQRTYERYRDIASRHLAPELGKRKVDNMPAALLQKFVNELSEKYSANTVIGITAVLRSSLTRAKKAGIIARHNADSLIMPKFSEKKVECFSAAEQRKIEYYVFNENKPKLCGIILCLYTGLRVGELLALEWKNVDLQTGRLKVEKSCRDGWNDGKYIKIIDLPKTETSVRVIPLPKQLIHYLKSNKRNSGYVVCGDNGEEISIRSYQKTFEIVLRELGIPHRGFHALRHTFATRALECGVDVKTLSELLGHKNPNVTLSRYAHSLLEHKCAMMNKIGKFLEK